jgi:hypothetical protein
MCLADGVPACIRLESLLNKSPHGPILDLIDSSVKAKNASHLQSC